MLDSYKLDNPPPLFTANSLLRFHAAECSCVPISNTLHYAQTRNSVECFTTHRVGYEARYTVVFLMLWPDISLILLGYERNAKCKGWTLASRTNLSQSCLCPCSISLKSFLGRWLNSPPFPSPCAADASQKWMGPRSGCSLPRV